MSGVPWWFIIFLLNLIAIDSKICDICKCTFLNTRPEEPDIQENSEIVGFDFKPDALEKYNHNISYGEFVEKYFYVDCFEENGADHIGNFQWPRIRVLGILANFKNVKWQKLENFPDDIRNQMTAASVSNNFITEIEKSELEGFVKLKMLNLSRNKIEKIGKSTFASVSSLEILDLSQNKISEVAEWAFYGTALHYLNLSKNSINHLEPNVFRGLNNLTYLDLSRNNLKKLSDNFGTNVPYLKFLFLQNNELLHLPQLPKKIKKLDVSNNDLSELRLTHSSLEILNLDKNHISSLADSNFSNLKVLIISNNKMKTLNNLGSSQIVILDVSYNQFSEIPEIITADKLPFLRELILNGNPITNVSFTSHSQPFENLRKVSFSNCNLKSLLQNSFENVFSDKKFDCLSQNGLTLNFSQNTIKYVEKEIFKNFQVCSVDLSHNKLRTLSESVLPWKEMFYINLQYNPWHCDCNIQWMLKNFLFFMYRNQPKLLFDLKCATPLRYKDKMFVMWYNRTENVFCNSGPSSFYLDLPGGKTVEIWKASAIACIVLGCFIIGILIAIIVLLCKTPNRKTKPRKSKRSSKNKPYYVPINNIADNREKINDNVV